MSEELTPRQQILLWDLISRGGSALQKDLKPEVKPADREPLKKAGCISVSTKTPYRLTIIEEKSWDYLAANPPTLLQTSGSKYDRPILQFVLERITDFAKKNDVGVGQVIAGKRVVETDKPHGSGLREHDSSIQKQIADAFAALAGRPAVNQVRLRALRERLSHISKERLDAVLREMRGAGRASFSTLSNPSDIEEEGDAALVVRDQHFHTIWIEQ